MSEQAFRFWKRSEITVLRLGADEFCDDTLHLPAQTRIVGQAQRLHGGDEILADEFPGPRYELRHRLSVAHAEHLDHARVGLRFPQQPVLDVRLENWANRPGKPELRRWHGIKGQ